MFNIRGILNRRNDQNRSPESLLSSRSSDDGVENSASSAEGFLCPQCFVAFPTADALQNHYESAHNEGINNVVSDGRNMFTCPACKMKLGSEIELQSHFTRHHSDKKEDVELRAMEMQVKVMEEGKALLQNELQTILKENTKLREERNGLEQKAAELAKELADMKLSFDELNSTKMYLENSLKMSEEKVSKMEIEMQQSSSEADDVLVLKKAIITVQEKMNELTLKKEAEKDFLQKQFNDLQEACLKLQTEKSNLESLHRSCPKKEEIESFQKKISEMSLTISNLKEDLHVKEVEKTKLQASLEKFDNYEEIKAHLEEKKNYADELLRQSSEKDSLINKLKEELKKAKDEVEETKIEKDRLFSEIAKGEGANAAMLQLQEENMRLQQQFIAQQTHHLEAVNETECKLNELRSLLKKTTASLHEYQEKCSELESELNQAHKKLQEIQNEKDSLSKDLNLQIVNLSAAQGADKARIQNLEGELSNLKKLYDEKCSSSAKELELVRISNTEVVEKLQNARKNQEKYISELAEKLAHVESDNENKDKSLLEAVKLQKELNASLDEERRSKAEIEEKYKHIQSAHEKMSNTLKNLEMAIAENEETKMEFSNRISSLNEELLKSQLNESELSAALENANEMNLKMKEKCFSLEEETKNLQLSVTGLQNEKNSLLNELEEEMRSIKELQELVASQDSKIKELTDLKNKEAANYQKVLNEFQLAREIYLKEKVKLQKQIEDLEKDCAKQLSHIQETVKSLEHQLEEAEEKSATLNASLEETKRLLKQKELEIERANADHIAQFGLLSGNIQTLREDLASEQKRRESTEQKLDEICGTKLELEAKLENALEERSGLLKRCIKSEAECEKLQKSVSDLQRKYDDCVAALQELGRENQTLQVENMKHITRKWADDGEVTHCTACGKLFTVTVRKHHCRNCGNIFCNECSAKSATVAASKKPVRVCDVCFTEVTK